MAQEDRKRKLGGEDARGANEVHQHEYNEKAGAKKVLGPILGKLIILGAANTAKSASRQGKLIALFNNSATVAFAKTGNASVTAPTGGADGICLKPNDYTIIALANDTHVIANAATVFAYEIDDATYWA